MKMVLGMRRSAFVRVAPFAVFMAVLALRGMAPADDSWGFDVRWLYALQVLVPAALLALWWREYGELSRQTLPTLREAAFAVAAGAAVFGLWIHLDAPWMTLNTAATEAFVPRTAAGALDWPLIAVRSAGAALLVPVMEELFWRSFLMRWLQAPLFEAVLPQRVGLKALVLSTFVFVLAHTLWLAAAIAGLIYAALYIRSGKLWLAVIAHAVTNGLLAVWVVATGNWQFW
jgi:CAAX prenyl protease-like protein